MLLIADEREDYPDCIVQRARVWNAITLPAALERVVCWGLAMCCEALLDILVGLPLRLVFATPFLCNYVYRLVVDVGEALATAAGTRTHKRCGQSAATSHRKCRGCPSSLRADLLTLALVGSSFVVLQGLDLSVLYHYIRAQTLMKLYVFFSIVQVFELMLRSIGEVWFLVSLLLLLYYYYFFIIVIIIIIPMIIIADYFFLIRMCWKAPFRPF
jgi:hypothetical protein